MLTKKLPKVATDFYCEKCDYMCCKKSSWDKHILTTKHQILTPQTQSIQKMYECECGKTYIHRQSLFNHKKKCIIEDSCPTQTNSSSESHLTNVILDLVKQNQEFKDLIVEQNKQMMEMVKEGKIINNTTNNNKFNLNIFLNEKCKDAMNIMDFANSLDIKLKELEDVGTLGYATGISNIIVRGLNELDIYKRPIHCSDLKRESMHVKDQNMWILDKEKTLLETAIKRVARKNILKVQDWKQANPEYAEINSKTMDKYGQILIEATGSFEPDEKERDMNKIIRNIAKEVIIEKM
jgi:ribosomal protein S9